MPFMMRNILSQLCLDVPLLMHPNIHEVTSKESKGISIAK